MDKGSYTEIYPHSKPKTDRHWEDPFLQIVSIDPARKNYALRIERRWEDGLVQTIAFKKVAVEAFDFEGGITVQRTFDEVTNFLDSLSKYWSTCHYVIIERQMPNNYKAVRISQHTLSYFSLVLRDLPRLPSLIEINSSVKTRILECPKKTDKKKWATVYARKLLEQRNDTFGLKVFNDTKKKDDLADTICQIEAFLKLWN